MLKVFGRTPSGPRRARIEQSPNYRDGVFRNLSPTEVMSPESSTLRIMGKWLNKPRNTEPPGPLPFIRTDLHALPDGAPVVVWFGHSSYLLKIKGKTVLVDPVFSGNASPFTFNVKAFPGSNAYRIEDFPDPDVLVLTHDHYDHLDYRTLLRLKNRVGQILCPLGVGEHLEYWGFGAANITELDWWEAHTIDDLHFTATPARHFSGRGFVRAKALWTAFALNTGTHRIYLGGDSGYDTHFKEVGQRFGPFDLALLEIGQYNTDWPLIHSSPEEAVQAALDLQARLLLPVHWAKFALAFHVWDEPIKRLLSRANEAGVAVATPRMGEVLALGTEVPKERWWEGTAG